MKQLKHKTLFIAFALIIVLASCHKDRLVQKQSPPPTAQRAGIYILNQGEFGDNNSTLTYYDYATKDLIPDQYSVANSAHIGDTGNDIEIYGSKMYIVVNVSSVVDIVNPKTSKLIKQDSLVNNHVAREPRSIAFYKGNAFITSYDGTVAVMDTATLTITKYITVGADPEQIVVSNGKIYVANSGGLSTTGFDNTVSVIDPATLTQTKKITVITNPVSMAADAYGNVYVLSLGDYNTIAGGMTIINSKTDAVASQPAVSLGYIIPITVVGDSVLYLTADNKVAVYNAMTQKPVSASFISDGTSITTPYAISGDPTTGEVFITDAADYASNGTLYAFDKTGKKEYSITVGINPGRITLVNK